MELTPQQKEFLSFYLDPKSETWSNAYQSAKKAGYSEEYSQNITGQLPDWLSENIRDTKLLETALNNLSEFMNTTDEKLQTLRWDATKTTLKGLGKNKFSERSELTGKNGEQLQVTIVKYEDNPTI